MTSLLDDRRRARHRSVAAFTLLEVMVALAVVAFAFVGLLGLHNRNLALVGRDQDLTRAVLLARTLISQIEVQKEFPDPGVSTGDFEDYPGFSYALEVEETSLPDVRRLTLRVIWDPRIPDACKLVYYLRDHREPEEF